MDRAVSSCCENFFPGDADKGLLPPLKVPTASQSMISLKLPWGTSEFPRFTYRTGARG